MVQTGQTGPSNFATSETETVFLWDIHSRQHLEMSGPQSHHPADMHTKHISPANTETAPSVALPKVGGGHGFAGGQFA